MSILCFVRLNKASYLVILFIQKIYGASFESYDSYPILVSFPFSNGHQQFNMSDAQALMDEIVTGDTLNTYLKNLTQRY